VIVFNIAFPPGFVAPTLAHAPAAVKPRTCRMPRQTRSGLSRRATQRMTKGGGSMNSVASTSTRVAIAGLGAIGKAVARRLTDGLPGLRLTAIATGNAGKARDWLKDQHIDCPVVELEEFPKLADLAVECAPASLLEKICRPMLKAGKQVMVLSCGALLPRPDLIELAKAHGGRILVPTGALLGLDAVAAAAEGKIYSVKMTTRKPPIGLVGAPHLVKNNISVEGLNTAKLVFSGTAREAAAGFPANVNVAAALSLAGIGPDKTMIDIWADPAMTRNCHSIEVDSDSARFTLSIENIPSENPKTGKNVALSVIAALRKMHAPLAVGT
jgi:aspartate dehydrogenase